jgi:hypothetical protein
MAVKIGFAILSYNEPDQLLRLVKVLNAMFGTPPIVCHHNFTQCALDETVFPANARFVHPHIETRWGHITTPLAALKAFDVLRKEDRPDWFVLLSGSDYPVQPADRIAGDLSNSDCDVYLDSREILYRALPPRQTATDGGYGRPSWIPMAYDTYCAVRLWWPRPSRKLLFWGAFPFERKRFLIRDPRLVRWLQFRRPQRVYGGGFWFQANRKAIDRLLDASSLPKLVRYYGQRQIPEESLFHTVLCSRAELRICTDNKRYEDWTRGGLHPKWLQPRDVPKILQSGAHFARKFRPDGAVQDLIDKTVLAISI